MPVSAENARSEPSAPAKPEDVSAALDRLAAVLCGDAILVLASGARGERSVLEGLEQRRADAYARALADQPHSQLTGAFGPWLVDMVRALAPLSPPTWVPMMQVVREKVTLELGARGLRSLFSSKPSEKDVTRVRRYGALAVRALRAVLAADGPLDEEATTTMAAVIASLGLPDADAATLSSEAPVTPETLDVYGEIDHAVALAIVRGAWLAAAEDGMDPREEHAIVVIGRKMSVADDDLEAARKEAQATLDARSKAGAAAVDGVRFVLSDRCPGLGVRVAALVGTLLVPRRWRDEALASVGQGAPVTLARRNADLTADWRSAVLGITWAAALMDNPSMARRALLGARWERFAQDLGDDDRASRELVETWVFEALGRAARTLA
jgi:hypothetical protein